MKLYHYNQTCSGGNFKTSDKLAVHTFIEAMSPREANNIAESIGIYFDGVESCVDCPCCGDRWDEQYGGINNDSENYQEFLINELLPVINTYSKYWNGSQWLIVHLYDGTMLKTMDEIVNHYNCGIGE